MTRLLELDTVQMRFGGVTALDDVSFHVDQGEILGLIGPNGAGKTTVFNVVTGVYRPTAGVVRFDGRTLRKERRSDITKLGIARTFQNIRLFPVMTALENVMVGRRRPQPVQRGRRARARRPVPHARSRTATTRPWSSWRS